MAFDFLNRLKSAWNVFRNRDPTVDYQTSLIGGYSVSPSRLRLSRGNERSILTSIYNRIAMDVASIDIKHVRLDDQGRYLSDEKSYLNERLRFSANVDQTGRAFIQDVALSLLDEGCVALVPIDIDSNPDKTDWFQILSIRVGRILEWYSDKVRVSVYDVNSCRRKELILPKTYLAIIESPLYSVINEPNSTMQRLARKLSLLDAVDEQNGKGKLDLIIQLPYSVRSEIKRNQAEQRRNDIEEQLRNSQFGIAYTEANEHIIQLNRPLESNLMHQVEYLTEQVFAQLGITQEIMNGTADENAFNNYYTRTVEPIVSAIVDEISRKFLSPTARAQKQAIRFFRDPFKLIPVNSLAQMADTLTRNEIMTSNEIRQKIGLPPSQDPKADQLVNSNINQAADSQTDKPLNDSQLSEVITQIGSNRTGQEDEGQNGKYM